MCWTLKHLFSLPKLGEHLIFKGGTSLSKAYNILERFSEDIDISIDRNYLGISGNLAPESAPSNKKQQALIQQLANTCKLFVQSDLLRQLNDKFLLSLSDIDEPWNIKLDTNDKGGQSILFYYPSQKQNTLNAYIQPAVKIELGARGADNPTKQCAITPFIEELIPGTLTEDSTQIKTLAAERTFWEKATILHMYAHWPDNKILPERQSRHFFDFYKLLLSETKQLAASDPALLEQVALHKKIYFRAGWAHYNQAIKGTLSLMPSEPVLTALENDYNKMHAMFYGETVSWKTVLNEIQYFEHEFNQAN